MAPSNSNIFSQLSQLFALYIFCHSSLAILFMCLACLIKLKKLILSLFPLCSTSTSLIDAVTNYHKFSDLRQFIILQFCFGGQKSNICPTWLKSVCLQGWFVLEALQEIHFFVFFAFLRLPVFPDSSRVILRVTAQQLQISLVTLHCHIFSDSDLLAPLIRML